MEHEQDPAPDPETDPNWRANWRRWRERVPGVLDLARHALDTALPGMRNDPDLRHWIAEFSAHESDTDDRHARYLLTRVEQRAREVLGHRDAHEQEVWQRVHPCSPPWERAGAYRPHPKRKTG